MKNFLNSIKGLLTLVLTFVLSVFQSKEQKKVKELTKRFKSLVGASFVGINNYLAKTSGELANFVINTNINVMTAKKADLQTLLNVNETNLMEFANKFNISFDICKTALNELIDSFTKNVSENLEDRTTASQAQTNAYINIANGLRLNIASNQLHVFGLFINKTVLVEGLSKKPVNSSLKTIAKNEIQKELKLKSKKFRTFIIDNANSLKIQGNIIQL
jgi:hypothetical protein